MGELVRIGDLTIPLRRWKSADTELPPPVAPAALATFWVELIDACRVRPGRSDLEVRTAEAIAAMVHGVIVPVVPCCDQFCTHVGLGATPAQARLILDALDVEWERLENSLELADQSKEAYIWWGRFRHLVYASRRPRPRGQGATRQSFGAEPQEPSDGDGYTWTTYGRDHNGPRKF